MVALFANIFRGSDGEHRWSTEELQQERDWLNRAIAALTPFAEGHKGITRGAARQRRTFHVEGRLLRRGERAGLTLKRSRRRVHNSVTSKTNKRERKIFPALLCLLPGTLRCNYCRKIASSPATTALPIYEIASKLTSLELVVPDVWPGTLAHHEIASDSRCRA